MSHDMGYVFMEVGHRVDILNQLDAIRAADAFKLAARTYPNADLCFMIGGYDKDKRELWEIEEVMQYVRWFANASGLNDWRNPVILRLAEDSIGLLVLSKSFADDHPFKVETPK